MSVGLALDEKKVDNGALWFVPGSRRMAFDADRFDAAKFFRAERAENADYHGAAPKQGEPSATNVTILANSQPIRSTARPAMVYGPLPKRPSRSATATRCLRNGFSRARLRTRCIS